MEKQQMREKLVELIDQARVVKTEYGVCISGTRHIADHLIANGVTFAEDINIPAKWISVKDRLPEEDEDIIAFCYYHESWQTQVCHLSSNYEGQWYTSVAGQWVRVTHWMPLPEPPKGE